MFIFFSFICIFLVTQGFLVLDEEMLIIMASVLWVDAAGGLIRKTIDSELVSKGDTIKEKFMWFLTTKQSIVNELIKLHSVRVQLPDYLDRLFATAVTLLVTKTLSNFYTHLEFVNKSARVSLVSEMSAGLAQAFYYDKLGKTLSLLADSGSDILFLGKHNTNPVFGSTKDLIVKA